LRPGRSSYRSTRRNPTTRRQRVIYVKCAFDPGDGELDLSESKRELHETVRADYACMDYGYVLRHSSNNHLIPNDERIQGQLFALRVGQIVQLQGDLVDAHSDDGWHANTSLTRDDDGEGACEVMLVRGVQVKN
jgi:hypothetical protein